MCKEVKVKESRTPIGSTLSVHLPIPHTHLGSTPQIRLWRVTFDTMLFYLHADGTPSAVRSSGSTSAEAGIMRDDSLPRPSAPPTTTSNALHHQQQAFPGTNDAFEGTRDRLILSLDPNALVIEKSPNVPEASSLRDQLPASEQQIPEAGESSNLTSLRNPLTGAPDYRAGTSSKRIAKVAPVRVWSKATIYAYASQGLSCQNTDTIYSSTGGNPYCLDVHAFATSDGAQVQPRCSRHAAVVFGDKCIALLH
jgi:hypothetical protein